MIRKIKSVNLVYFTAIALIVSLQYSCSSTDENTSDNRVTDSTISDTTVSTIERSDWVAENSIIEFDTTPIRSDTNGYAKVCAQIVERLGYIPTIADVRKLAAKAIAFKDSIEYARGTQDLTEPKDSALFAPLENDAKQAMMAYRELVSYGVPLTGSMPRIINTKTKVDDNILRQLPEISASMPLSDRNFFFIGACTFFQKQEMTDGKPFLSPDGKPEIRYSGNLNKNANYVLDVIRRLPQSRMAVSFGNALNSYENGPQEVKGIGSLIHQLHDRVPVYFLTEKGIVAAHLIAVKTKLVDESLGCISDYDEITVACLSMPDTEILGIYLPYDNSNLTTCTMQRNDGSWLIDINNDGTPDFASVFSSSTGEASGNTIVTQTWFVNVNGSWQIIDSANDLDCT